MRNSVIHDKTYIWVKKKIRKGQQNSKLGPIVVSSSLKKKKIRVKIN